MARSELQVGLQRKLEQEALLTDQPEPDVPEEYRHNPFSASVDFDGRHLVVQSSGNAVSTHDFTEDEFLPEGWGDEHPDWVRDTAIGLAERYFEEIWG